MVTADFGCARNRTLNVVYRRRPRQACSRNVGKEGNHPAPGMASSADRAHHERP